MKDLTKHLQENGLLSTPQSMPNIGAIQNAEINDTTAGVMKAQTGTDIPNVPKKKKDK